ncbi:MAG: hypothetical protein ACE366_29195 [Bradymonadia bacterium]
MSARKLAAFLTTCTAMLVASHVSAAPDQAAMQMIPSDTTAVVSFDMQRIRKAPLYQSMVGMAKQAPDGQKALAEIKAKTGVDIEKDIDSVILAIPADVDKSEAVVVIVKGKLDQGKLTAAAVKEGKAKEASHNGVKTVAVDGGSFAFMNGYLVAGPTVAVHKAIDASKGKGGLNKALSQAISKVDTGKDMWMAVNINDQMRKNMPPDPMTKALTGLRGSIDMAKGFGLKLDMSTNDAAKAAEIAKMITAQLNAQNGAPPMFANMLKKITAKASGKDVNINVALSSADVDMLKGLLMMGMAAGGK